MIKPTNHDLYVKYRDQKLVYQKTYVQRNRATVNENARVRQKNRYHTEEKYRLLLICRNRMRSALKGLTKSARTATLLGCTIEELRRHLEAQFQPGMTWDNYGRKGWHIDHRRPCASFNLIDETQQHACFHWTNLQPLWAVDNLKKGAKHFLLAKTPIIP